MKTIFVVCQHGDEKTPLEVIKNCFIERVEYLVAHPQASKANKRFIKTDLNRSFPGNLKGSKEEVLAYKLKEKLKGYDVILDFHTASIATPIFTILTKNSPNHLKLAKDLGIKRIVFMENSIASGKALIDSVPLGISIESGREGMKSTYHKIKVAISCYLNNKKPRRNFTYYAVFQILKKGYNDEKLNKHIKSFKLVKKGELLSKKDKLMRFSECDFYSILPREKSYKGVLCMMARQTTEDELLMLK